MRIQYNIATRQPRLTHRQQKNKPSTFYENYQKPSTKYHFSHRQFYFVSPCTEHLLFQPSCLANFGLLPSFFTLARFSRLYGARVNAWRENTIGVTSVDNRSRAANGLRTVHAKTMYFLCRWDYTVG